MQAESARMLQDVRSSAADVGAGLLTAVREWSLAARAEIDRTKQELRATHQEFEEGVRRTVSEVEKQLAHLRQERAEMQTLLQALPTEIAAIEQRIEAVRTRIRETDQKMEKAEASPPASEGLPASGPQATPAKPQEPPHLLGMTVESGLVVAEVEPDSPAAQAGLAMGDEIVSINGIPAVDAAKLRDLIHVVQGEEIILRIARNGSQQDCKVRYEAASTENSPTHGETRLGLTVAAGVVVAEVLPGTPAERAGIAPGDTIRAANGTPITSSLQLRELLHQSAPEHEITLQTNRGTDAREVKVAPE